MKGYLRGCYQIAGPLAERRMAKHADLQAKLFRAHMTVRAAAFVSAMYVSAALAAIGAALLAGIVLFAIHAPTIVLVALPILAASWIGVSVFALAPLVLSNAAREKAKEIDESLPAGLNYMLALASSGMPPVGIWASLSRADVFGALAFEAERIHRDLALFSMDILQALRLAQERTPSAAFHEFLQGAISAFQSGVELESYIKTKCEQYQQRVLDEQRRDLDTMGLMAEAFLVVVVAAPLFLIILLTVMTINQGPKVIAYGYALTFLLIPATQLLMGTIIRGMSAGASSG